MAGSLSPLQLQAAATLLQNQGIVVNSSLVDVLDRYNSGLVHPLLRTIENGGSVLSAGVISTLKTLGSGTVPALSDSIPSAYITPLSNKGLTVATNPPGFTGLVLTTGMSYLGQTWADPWPGQDGSTSGYGTLSVDNSIFAQTLSIASGYSQTTNTFINCAVKSQDYLSDTFTDMNNLVTGDLTQVNLDTVDFGNDLANLGTSINLANLDNLGTPLALVQCIIKAGGIVAPILLEFSLVGIDDNIILSLNDPTLIVTDTVQKSMYQAMSNITGDDLIQILTILNVTTENIVTLADLLNPVKMFPNSFQTITTPTCNGNRGVYLNAIGTVNGGVISQLIEPMPGISYLRLSKIIPADQALANKALAISLLQVTNIGRIGTLSNLATAYKNVETNANLPDINAQLQPVPTDSLNYILNRSPYTNGLAQGTGENGTILITDLLGAASGTVYTQQLETIVTTIDTIDTSTLATLYTQMLGVINGTYGDPTVGPVVIPTGPAAGTYTDGDDAFVTGLIPAAQSELVILSGLPETTTLNSCFNTIAQKLLTEATLQSNASLVIGDLVGNSQPSTQSLVFALPGYGINTEVGGTADYIESVSDLSIAGGQAIVGCLRQGRIDIAVDGTGVGKSNSISGTPATASPQANLLPTTYTADQAKSQIIY